jgi:hypothetical protein
MHAAHQLGRDFVGCDLVYEPKQLHLPWRDEWNAISKINARANKTT